MVKEDRKGFTFRLLESWFRRVTQKRGGRQATV